MPRDLLGLPAALLGDEPDRGPLHEPGRESADPPGDPRCPRGDQHRLVAAYGVEHLGRQDVGVQRSAYALALEVVVAPVEQPDLALVQQGRLHGRRADHGHAHPLGRGLRAERQREPDHGVLGHHVARDQPGRHQSAHRRGVDDASVPLPHHQRVRRGDAVHHTADVHVDQGVPLLEAEVLGLAAEGDAGVVEHQVQPSLAGDDVVDQGLDRPGVGDVHLHRPGLARPGHRRRGPGRGGEVQVGDGRPHSCSDQRADQRCPHAGAATCHDRGEPGQVQLGLATPHLSCVRDSRRARSAGVRSG